MSFKCRECVAEGHVSIVYPPLPHEIKKTTVPGDHRPFFDEGGVYHRHEPTVNTAPWFCSRGHRWAESYVEPCIQGQRCHWNNQTMRWYGDATVQPQDRLAAKVTQ